MDTEDMREQARRWRALADRHDPRAARALRDAAEIMERRAQQAETEDGGPLLLCFRPPARD